MNHPIQEGQRKWERLLGPLSDLMHDTAFMRGWALLQQLKGEWKFNFHLSNFPFYL